MPTQRKDAVWAPLSAANFLRTSLKQSDSPRPMENLFSTMTVPLLDGRISCPFVDRLLPCRSPVLMALTLPHLFALLVRPCVHLLGALAVEDTLSLGVTSVGSAPFYLCFPLFVDFDRPRGETFSHPCSPYDGTWMSSFLWSPAQNFFPSPFSDMTHS